LEPSDIRRLEYDVGIGHGDDIGRAKPLILQAIRGVETGGKRPSPEVLVVQLADSGVHIRARWWIRPPRRANVVDQQENVLAVIKQTLSANGIDLSLPTRRIPLHGQTEETDGHQSRQREGWSAGNGQVQLTCRLAVAVGRLADGYLSKEADGPASGKEEHR